MVLAYKQNKIGRKKKFGLATDRTT